jgi:hypothetical protein
MQDRPLSRFLQAVSPVRPSDNAYTTQLRVWNALRCAGFDAIMEARVQGGYIDIAARSGAFTIGCEIDRGSPRKKSIRKLLGGHFDARVVLLRSGINENRPDGIVVRVLTGR